MVMDHCLKMILVNMSNVYSPKSSFHLGFSRESVERCRRTYEGS